MASGKARSTKRSSATSSYSSATTIVIFVGLSVLGLWLLTSNSLAPPQSTTRTTTTTTTTASKTPSRITSIGHTHQSQTQDNENDPSSTSDASQTSAHLERSTDDNADEAVIEPETKIENDESQTDNDAQTDHQDDKDSSEEQEKQAALETQTSEESSITQKQVVEQIIEENPHSETDTKVETNDLESNTNHTSEETSSETTENQITDEDQQQRIDEHQQREDEQNQQGEQEAQSKDPNGAISHDQIQHDEAPIVPHQDASSFQAIDQETKHDSLDENRDKTTLSQKMNEETTIKNGDNSEIPEESTESKKSWTTQAHESEDQKERRKTGSTDEESSNHGYTWLLCNVTAGADYIPCLDNEKVIANIHSRLHHEHRERHCPTDPSTCLVPLTHHWQNIRGTRTG